MQFMALAGENSETKKGEWTITMIYEVMMRSQHPAPRIFDLLG